MYKANQSRLTEKSWEDHLGSERLLNYFANSITYATAQKIFIEHPYPKYL